MQRVLFSNLVVFVLLNKSCPRVGWTRGSGRVGILPDFVGSGRVSTSDFQVFYLLFLNRYESSNTAFGLIDFLR